VEILMSKQQSDQEVRDLATEERWRKHREELLDDALDDTFPASDPVSIAPRPPWRKKGKP
jgi:hypothetical protein